MGQHEEDLATRGSKSGLKLGRQKPSELQFHTDYGHLGFCPGCRICRMVKGTARRIYRKVDPHKEERAGQTWHTGTVTLDSRSSVGNKYMTILRDEASGIFVVFNHYLKSDILDVFAQWLEVTRRDPAFHNCSYKVISCVCLDNVGKWALGNEKWQFFCKSVGINLIHSCPDRKESAARAERAVGIVEVATKTLLMQKKKYHRCGGAQWCAIAAVWLLNRFLVTSQLEHY